MSARHCNPCPSLWRIASRVAYAISLVGSIQGASMGADYAIESFAEPNLKLELAASEPGVLDQLLVKEGEHVAAGALIASLDIEVLQAQQDVYQFRADAEGTRASAAAELEVRQQRLAALQELDSHGHANRAEILRAQADLRIAQAGLQNVLDEQRVMQLEVERIRRQIRRRQVYSPIDGVVIKIHKELGESIPMNAPEVVTIAQLHPLRVHFPVSVKDLERLKNGQPVTVRFPDTNQSRVGKVELISPVMDPKSSTIDVTVLVPNQEEPLLPGLRCVMEVEAGFEAPAAATPLAGPSTPAVPAPGAEPADAVTARETSGGPAKEPLRKTSVATPSRFRWPFSGAGQSQ